MQAFEIWIESIVSSLQKKVKKLAIVESEFNGSYPVRVWLSFIEIPVSWSMSFDKTEFRMNTKRQRQRLVKVRRDKLVREMNDFTKILVKTTNRLK